MAEPPADRKPASGSGAVATTAAQVIEAPVQSRRPRMGEVTTLLLLLLAYFIVAVVNVAGVGENLEVPPPGRRHWDTQGKRGTLL